MICSICSVVFVLCLFMGISRISSLATVTIKTRSARFHLWTIASPFSFRVLPSVLSKSSKRNFYKKVAFWAYQTQNWVELFWKGAFWASNAEPNGHWDSHKLEYYWYSFPREGEHHSPPNWRVPNRTIELIFSIIIRLIMLYFYKEFVTCKH